MAVPPDTVPPGAVPPGAGAAVAPGAGAAVAPGAGAALLLLADGRLPSGGHAHSGGLEEAVARGAVRHTRDLERWLEGRLHTVGLVDATFAAAANGGHGGGHGDAPVDRVALDGDLAARVPSAAVRAAGRAQGRGLLRTGRRAWPAPALDDLWQAAPGGVLWPVALGAVAAAAGIGPADTATVAATASVQGPAWAATRLLSLDPLEVAAVLARLAGSADGVAADAARRALAGDLPAASAPLIEIGAEAHASWEVRLFAS